MYEVFKHILVVFKIDNIDIDQKVRYQKKTGLNASFKSDETMTRMTEIIVYIAIYKRVYIV